VTPLNCSAAGIPLSAAPMLLVILITDVNAAIKRLKLMFSATRDIGILDLYGLFAANEMDGKVRKIDPTGATDVQAKAFIKWRARIVRRQERDCSSQTARVGRDATKDGTSEATHHPLRRRSRRSRRESSIARPPSWTPPEELWRPLHPQMNRRRWMHAKIRRKKKRGPSVRWGLVRRKSSAC
jgi:hypothetical protein